MQRSTRTRAVEKPYNKEASPVKKVPARSKALKLELEGEVGQVFVVGSGDCGQLGLGQDVLEKERPALLSYFNDKKIVKIYAGGLHNICLSKTGKVNQSHSAIFLGMQRSESIR
jgi:alpha-tubulin suppressor-like RCC1 family protein